jgi:hypothetical protein
MTHEFHNPTEFADQIFALIAISHLQNATKEAARPQSLSQVLSFLNPDDDLDSDDGLDTLKVARDSPDVNREAVRRETLRILCFSQMDYDLDTNHGSDIT